MGLGWVLWVVIVEFLKERKEGKKKGVGLLIKLCLIVCYSWGKVIGCVYLLGWRGSGLVFVCVGCCRDYFVLYVGCCC